MHLPTFYIVKSIKPYMVCLKYFTNKKIQKQKDQSEVRVGDDGNLDQRAGYSGKIVI